ncbi:hypothetical protein LguiA_013051 [Lonicera macranthoides]
MAKIGCEVEPVTKKLKEEIMGHVLDYMGSEVVNYMILKTSLEDLFDTQNYMISFIDYRLYNVQFIEVRDDPPKAPATEKKISNFKSFSHSFFDLSFLRILLSPWRMSRWWEEEEGCCCAGGKKNEDNAVRGGKVEENGDAAVACLQNCGNGFHIKDNKLSRKDVVTGSTRA